MSNYEYYPQRAWMHLRSFELHQVLDHTDNAVKYVRADLIEDLIKYHLEDEFDVLAGNIIDLLEDILNGKYEK